MSSFKTVQAVRGVDPRPACHSDADWTASGDGGWYVVVPLADGGDATSPAAASGTAVAGNGSGAAVSSAMIDWEQIETHERGYLVSFHYMTSRCLVSMAWCSRQHPPHIEQTCRRKRLDLEFAPRR